MIDKSIMYMKCILQYIYQTDISLLYYRPENSFIISHVFKNSDAGLHRKCSVLKSESNLSLRWSLIDCESLHPSICAIKACEQDSLLCDQRCVNSAWICDGQWDCSDGLDESDCTESEILLCIWLQVQHFLYMRIISFIF